MTAGEDLGRLLKQRGKSIALAESMTGGLASSLITDVPGSSEYFFGSIVAYSNDLKIKLLGVKRSTLEARGAVSEETSIEMAQGIRDLTGADIGASITGIAGPRGATDEKPIGLVYFAVSTKEGIIQSARYIFNGDRREIKKSASEYLLRMIIDLLRNQELS